MPLYGTVCSARQWPATIGHKNLLRRVAETRLARVLLVRPRLRELILPVRNCSFLEMSPHFVSRPLLGLQLRVVRVRTHRTAAVLPELVRLRKLGMTMNC